MEPLYDRASVIRLLKRGLKAPNPSNPERTEWTLADLDKDPTASQRSVFLRL